MIEKVYDVKSKKFTKALIENMQDLEDAIEEHSSETSARQSRLKSVVSRVSSVPKFSTELLLKQQTKNVEALSEGESVSEPS